MREMRSEVTIEIRQRLPMPGLSGFGDWAHHEKTVVSRQVLVNAITVKVGRDTQVTGYATS